MDYYVKTPTLCKIVFDHSSLALFLEKIINIFLRKIFKNILKMRFFLKSGQQAFGSNQIGNRWRGNQANDFVEDRKSFKGKIKKFDSDNYDKEHFISDEMGEDVNGGKYEPK